MVCSGSLIRNFLSRYFLFPSINPNTSAVSAPDSPNEFAKKNSKNKTPSVSM